MPLDTKNDLNKIFSTLSEIFKNENKNELVTLISCAVISSEMSYYDNWNNGQYYYTIYISVPIDIFIGIQDKIEETESFIATKIELINRAYLCEHIDKVIIIPQQVSLINWDSVADITTKDKTINCIDFLKNTLTTVSTGGMKIQDINNHYKNTYNLLDRILRRINIDNPNPYNDLWLWHGKWSSDLPTYASRRSFIINMYNDLYKTVNESDTTENYYIDVNLEGWPKINRSIMEIKKRLYEAITPEQFQSIGHLSREAIISLGQQVFNKDLHIMDSLEVPSKTDANGMLEAYFKFNLVGSSNETTRRYAKSTLALANELTHKRTATKKDALLCNSAMLSLINLVRIVEQETGSNK